MPDVDGRRGKTRSVKKPARKSICALAFEILAAEEKKARRAKKEDQPAKPAQAKQSAKRPADGPRKRKEKR